MRSVVYDDWESFDDELLVIIDFEELRVGLESSYESGIILSCQFPSACVSKSDGVFFVARVGWD